MSKLFVSWVVNRSVRPPEFGNVVLEYREPESELDVMKIELMIQNILAKRDPNSIAPPTLLHFKKLEG